MKLFAFILALGTTLGMSLAQAEIGTTKVGSCKHLGVDYALYTIDGAPLTEGVDLHIVTSQLAKSTGLHLGTGGFYRPSKGEIEFYSFWRPARIPLSDCKMGQALKLMRFGPPIHLDAILHEYFVQQMPGPGVDIVELCRRKEAIPIKVPITCVTDDPGTDPSLLKCQEIRIKDSIIPVDPNLGCL